MFKYNGISNIFYTFIFWIHHVNCCPPDHTVPLQYNVESCTLATDSEELVGSI